MIVADTSVIVAMAKREPGSEQYGALLARESGMIGTPSLVEVQLVLSSILKATDVDLFLADLRYGGLRPVDFTPAMADAAVEAFRRFGKGRGHPAQLNFGDCMAYAVAKVLDVSLLYKGGDFAHTDIRPALQP